MRLYQYAVARLVDYSRPIPREQVRTAIENRVKGKGTVEFYVGGRLVYTVFFKPNADFMVDCCEVEPNYYPWYKAPKPKTGPRRNPNNQRAKQGHRMTFRSPRA